MDQSSYQPSFFSESSDDANLESQSTQHMVQWERATLEAEIQLSKDPLLLNSQSAVKTENDYFLRLWNSEVGESFRKVNDYEVACQSPVSQVSSSTRDESSSGVTIHTNDPPRVLLSPARTTNTQKHAENVSVKKDPEDHLILGSESSKSYELDESSDATMKLLLDFPQGDEMEYLQEPVEDVSIYLQDPF